MFNISSSDSNVTITFLTESFQLNLKVISKHVVLPMLDEFRQSRKFVFGCDCFSVHPCDSILYSEEVGLELMCGRLSVGECVVNPQPEL